MDDLVHLAVDADLEARGGERVALADDVDAGRVDVGQ